MSNSKQNIIKIVQISSKIDLGMVFLNSLGMEAQSSVSNVEPNCLFVVWT